MKSNSKVLPPVRKKKKSMKETQKTKEQIKSPQTKRIKGYDYSSWDKFDVVGGPEIYFTVS